MAEDSDYTPGPWKGHDFTAAKKAYDAHVGRSYADATKSGVTLGDLVPESLSTNSSAPLVIVTDQTGSMGEWPAVMFSKLPYLEYEAKEYLGDDMEISWSAIGDAHSSPQEYYPLQVREFTHGVDLKDELEKLVIERKGGNQVTETYELAALYYARNVLMPEAIIRPIIIFIGDEKPYEFVDPDTANRVARVTLERRITTAEVFAELRKKFSVYLILKPYGSSSSNAMDSTNVEIRNAWANHVGLDHIADLPNPERVVDVIFGILAKETMRIDYFKKEIEDRQEPEKVEVVYRSLDTIHKLPPGRDDNPSDSRMLGDVGGAPSRPLMP